MKYRIGDKVRVIQHHNPCEKSGKRECVDLNSSMMDQVRKVLTIRWVGKTNRLGTIYKVRENSFWWSDCMIEPYNKKTEETEVTKETFVCQSCDKRTPESEENITSDEISLCNDCYENNTWDCSDCEETFFHDEDKRFVDDNIVCQSCIDNDYSYCCGCERYYLSEDTNTCGECGDIYCESCLLDHGCESRGEDFTERPESSLHYKGDKKGKYLKVDRLVGVEIEAEEGHASEAQNDIPSSCGITKDGSLNNTGVEVQTPPASMNQAETIIAQACEGLTKNGFVATSRCGLHVHIDAHDIRNGGIIKVFKTIYAIEDVLYSMLPDSRWDNHYCIPFRKNYSFFEMFGKITKDQLEKRWYKDTNRFSREERKHQKYDSTRYAGTNVHSYFYKRTIEFRQHSGTVNAEKIEKWIAVLLSIVEYALHRYNEKIILRLLDMHMSREKVHQVLKLLNLSAPLRAYVVKRISTHNPNFRDIIGEPKPYAIAIKEYIYEEECKAGHRLQPLRNRFSYIFSYI